MFKFTNQSSNFDLTRIVIGHVYKQWRMSVFKDVTYFVTKFLKWNCTAFSLIPDLFSVSFHVSRIKIRAFGTVYDFHNKILCAINRVINAIPHERTSNYFWLKVEKVQVEFSGNRTITLFCIIQIEMAKINSFFQHLRIPYLFSQ